MDGYLLYEHLTAAPANKAHDGIAEADTQAKRDAIDVAAGRWLAWFERLLHQPAEGTNPSWKPPYLEHQFACSAPWRGGEKVLTAEEYHHGHLDWFSLDIDQSRPTLDDDAPADTEQQITRTFVPSMVTFGGMPHPRWWSFEDWKTNLSFVTPDTTDLNKLLLLDFLLIFANDWFVLPVTVPVGGLTSVRGLVVSNVFGEQTWVEAAGRGSDETWQRWNMFTLAIKGNENVPADLSTGDCCRWRQRCRRASRWRRFSCCATKSPTWCGGSKCVCRSRPAAASPAPKAATSSVEIAAVDFCRASARSPGRAEGADPVSDRQPGARALDSIRARPHREPDARDSTAARVAAPHPRERSGRAEEGRAEDVAAAPGSRPAAAPEEYFVHEEEVGRAGVAVRLSFQRTRWYDGRVVLWLDARARTIAAALADMRGDRALLVYPPGLEYVAALFGCYYAGVVAVPAYPPDPSRLERSLPRLEAIIRDAEPRVVLTLDVLTGLLGDDVLATDTLPAGSWFAPGAPDDVALLQYTSGSTAAPRGVMLTHAQPAAQLRLHPAARSATPADSRGVIWLPPYHDMGLIGGILQPVFVGFPCT